MLDAYEKSAKYRQKILDGSLIISLIFSGCSSKENNKKNNENPQAKQQQLGSQTQEDEIPSSWKVWKTILKK